jgi:hypothetical protein
VGGKNKNSLDSIVLLCNTMIMGKIRDVILEEMLKSQLTIYQVSNIVRHKIPQRTVYAFLTGEKDTGTETASIIMDALGLIISRESKGKTYLKEEEIMNTKNYNLDTFINDDKAYLQWLTRNSTGFVVNCYLRPSPDYLILHRASCWAISTATRTNWTTTGYIKICSLHKRDLEAWAEKEVGGQLCCCKICKP